MNAKRTDVNRSGYDFTPSGPTRKGRRRFVQAGGLAALGAMLPRGLQAAGPEVVVADYGGVTRDVSRRAFYDPFKAASGINVIEATTTGFAQLEAMVMA